MENVFICKFCGKQCKNPNSLRNHERLCPNNKDRVYKSHTIGHTAWNKGKTKETDERVRKYGETCSEGYNSGRLINSNLGKHHTEEEKKHLSEKRKQFLKEHPEKVPYVLNHHSKGDSYPEKYFKEVFDNEKINYEQNYKQSGYFLDFAWPEKKLYLEIDGEQHYVDKRIIEHDKVRTETLSNEGWVCVVRIRWSEYQKLNEAERKDYLKMVFTRLK